MALLFAQFSAQGDMLHISYFFDTSQQPSEAGVIISLILQMKKWEVRRVIWHVQDHTISKF